VPGAQATLGSGGMLAEATVYAGFRPARDKARSGPIRLFIERRLNDRRDIATDQFFLDEQEGYLVENGVPGGVLEQFRRRGFVIAAPHYLLRERALGARDSYYVVAGLGGFFGLMFVVIAAAVTAQPRRPQS
jgi:hypothetical protein